MNDKRFVFGGDDLPNRYPLYSLFRRALEAFKELRGLVLKAARVFSGGVSGKERRDFLVTEPYVAQFTCGKG